MPPPPPDQIPARRHRQWKEHHHWWRWLAHSLEGGQTYRGATYGSLDYQAMGLGHPGHATPVRNLYRYKMEVPDWKRGDTEHPDYALRLARTPAPTLLPEAIEAHLAEIYSRDIEREHADPELAGRLDRWWANVDGADTSADEWFAEVVAPYLLALGCLDIAIDRAPAPEGEPTSLGAEEELGLDHPIAAIVWPWDVLDWELDPATKAYRWVVNLESGGDASGLDRQAWRLRLWTEADWTLVDGNGKVVATAPHPYGRVPQFRAHDRPNPRKEHVGRARYEPIAEIQRESYNKESELVLGGARHSYPILQIPPSMAEAAGGEGAEEEVEITPSKMVRMGRNPNTGEAQGLQYLDVPQGPGDSLRTDQDRYRDMADRHARLTKPAGARGTGGNTVAQSGISKLVDEKPSQHLCRQIARALYKAEWQAAVLALEVGQGARLTPEQRDALRIVYPTDYDLIDHEAWTALVLDFYAALDRSGAIPELDIPILQRFARLVLPGRDDEAYEPIDRAIEAHVRRRADEREQERRAMEAAARAATATATGTSTSTGATEPGQPEGGPGGEQGILGRLGRIVGRNRANP